MNIVVVGTGFSGSIIARQIAESFDVHVKVVEKRSHIGGNMYDEVNEQGILVQKYGPHFLNTNKYFIIKFLMQYAELFPHNTKLLSFIDGKYIRLPFNFTSVQQLVGAEKAEGLLKKFREYFKGRDRVPVLEIIDHEDEEVHAFGELLFEKAYRNYTTKMWDTPPEKVDKYILNRVPMAMNYDERYLNADFQYLPVNGYHEIFENMLNHPNISVELNVDALDHIKLDPETKEIFYDGEKVDCLVYTGPIDELFGYKYGELPYRSLDIRYNSFEEESVLPCEIISYPQADGYTRKTEYRKIMADQSKCKGSVVATEYPLPYDKNAETGNTPYYPLMTPESLDTYKKYKEEVTSYKGLFLCGRLAEFRYYNMDVCIEHALESAEHIKSHLKEIQ